MGVSCDWGHEDESQIHIASTTTRSINVGDGCVRRYSAVDSCAHRDGDDRSGCDRGHCAAHRPACPRRGHCAAHRPACPRRGHGGDHRPARPRRGHGGDHRPARPRRGHANAEAVAPSPASEVTYDRQKELLRALVQEWFVGVNNLDRPRLKLLPDVRDNRRGGILIHIEINGDEYDTTTKKKAELDILMRDTYELIYTTGYEVTEVAITAVMNGVRHITAKTASIEPIQAFRSRLRGDAAATVDWANKDSLDFNEIWDNVLLNTAWKRELAEEAEAGP